MRRNAKKGMEKSGKALETAKTMGYTKIITEGKKMGIHMKKYINTSRRINTKESEEWGFIVINALKKVWFATLIIELFLFIFFQPNEECSRGYYFYLFVARPSIGQGVWLAAGDILFKKFIKDKSHRTVSIFMILLVSGFAAVPVWVHTSVGLMPVTLLFPMVLCPFYRDWKMMLLQAGLSTALYAAYQGYFLPHSLYLPPGNLLIDVTIFAGCTFVTFVLEEQVNLSYILQEEKSVRDSLTHLYNHETFYEELEYHMKRYEEKKETFSVMIADIDNFKKVNDTYGHAFGDEVIRQVVVAFAEGHGNNDFSARYGGEEFAMILPKRGIEEAMGIAENIRKKFEEIAFQTELGEKHFTLSIGVAEYTKIYENASTFFEQADKALYEAKRSGKNRVCCAKSAE